MKKLNCIIAVLLPLTVLLNCNSINDIGEADGEPVINGRLFTEGGKKPAAGVLVKLIKQDAIVAVHNSLLSKSTSEETISLTDSRGRYRFPLYKEGTYVIEAIIPAGYGVRINPVFITALNNSQVIPDYTLYKNGALSGTIVLSDGGDFENVFVLAYGSNRFSQARSDGTFFMEGLPYGQYRLKLICLLPGYEDSRTIDVTITPDDTTYLGAFHFKAKEIGVPETVSLVYDTLTWIPKLNWSRVTGGGDISGYNIYRYDVDVANQYPNDPINTAPVSDTLFIDSTAHVNKSYTYGIAAVTRDNRIGNRSSPVTVTVVPYLFDTDTITTTDQSKPIGLKWTDGKLVIGNNSNGHLTIEEYSEEGLFLKHRETSIPIKESDHVQFDNDCYVVVSESSPNVIAGYDTSSQLRYRFTVEQSQRLPCVYNDTIYATTWDRSLPLNLSTILYEYDTTGNVLFSLDASDQLYLINHSTDDRILVSTYKNFAFSISTFDQQLQNSDAIIDISSRGVMLLDACANRYLVYINTGFMVVDNNGRELCDIMIQSFGRGLQPNAAVISHTGRIAFIIGSKVILLRLPANL